jgi:hypothetical protein
MRKYVGVCEWRVDCSVISMTAVALRLRLTLWMSGSLHANSRSPGACGRRSRAEKDNESNINSGIENRILDIYTD